MRITHFIIWATILFFISNSCFSHNIIPSPKVIEIGQGHPHAIRTIRYEDNDDSRFGYYTLEIKKGKVLITGNKNYGMETLRQLKDSNGLVPDVKIEDWATFQIRGFMHDVGRNFRPVELIKKDLEYIASYKLNIFHFHLTDNPAWRIECKCHPELNNPKYQRKGRDDGKFYSYDEIRDLISFARNLGITIIPEIDMPGHSKYFTDTFGFSMDSPQGKKILEELLDEFFNEINSADCPYFHIGSDEIHIEDKKGFMNWAENIVRKYGRRAIAWDPGLPSDSTTIRQIWNEATEKSGYFIDSYIGYLNYYDPTGFIHRAFLHKTPDDKEHALGGILCLWNDVKVSDQRKLCAHNGMETGVMAFSERMWNGGGYNQNSDIVPPPSSEAGAALSLFEKKMSYHKKYLIHDRDIRWDINSTIPWKIKIGDNNEIKAWGGSVNLDMLAKEHSIIISDTIDCMAETELVVSSDTTIKVLIGFEAAARSNRISGGIGEQGKFENRGQVFVNGIEIFPAQRWNEPGKYHFEFNTWHLPEEELPYTDEQFYWMREPVDIKLVKGVNHIKLHTPKTFKGQRWSFAFIQTL